MNDPQAVTSENKAFRGINLSADLQAAYRQFCKNEKVPVPAVDLGEVIDHYKKRSPTCPARIIGFGRAGLPCGLVWCRRFRAPAPIRTGRAIPGARRRSGIRAGIMASAVASNNRRCGAPTPTPSGITTVDAGGKEVRSIQAMTSNGNTALLLTAFVAGVDSPDGATATPAARQRLVGDLGRPRERNQPAGFGV